MIEAIISDDGLYQYQLTYRWDDGPLCGWICLNPSYSGRPVDADGVGGTAKVCATFTKAWGGFGGIILRNRFAYRVTDSRELFTVREPHGVENHMFLRRCLLDPVTIAAWGSAKAVRIAKPIPADLKTLRCIGVNLDGQPRHPLHAPVAAETYEWRNT